jgi:hypothetical protein
LYLLDKKLITLGLYRLKGATDNAYPYVYTNPKFETIIPHRDRVFILGIDIPNDLQGDYYEMMDREIVSSPNRHKASTNEFPDPTSLTKKKSLFHDGKGN